MVKLSIIFFLTSINMIYSQNDMNKLSWIIDKWVNKEGETTSYEHWEKINDTLYSGGSETVKGKDTLFSEKLKIEYSEGNIYYVADVKHNPEPVKFKLVMLTENEAVFENPEHDFPQKIIYRQVDGNLHASIEGPAKNNEWKKIDFHMNKMR